MLSVEVTELEKYKRALRRIRALAFKQLKQKQGFKMAVKIASDVLELENPIEGGKNGVD